VVVTGLEEVYLAATRVVAASILRVWRFAALLLEQVGVCVKEESFTCMPLKKLPQTCMPPKSSFAPVCH
jgi:hypothetical protein